MTRFDTLNLNTPHTDREIDMLPQGATGDMGNPMSGGVIDREAAAGALEVCPICDIAGCRHIRERTGPFTPTETADLLLVERAFKAGLAYAGISDVTDPDQAWRQSNIRLAALRALPTAPEAGEVELLTNRAEVAEYKLRMAVEEIQPMIIARAERAESSLAEMEAERDAASRDLLQHRALSNAFLVCAYDCAASVQANGFDLVSPIAASAIRALTPAAAKAALERIIADRVQAALAAQGEPVAWQRKLPQGYWVACDVGDLRLYRAQKIEVRPLYVHPAPASAGVTVKPLVDAARAVIDRWDSPLWAGSEQNVRHTGEYIDALRTALAALSQPVVQDLAPEATDACAEQTEIAIRKLQAAAREIDPRFPGHHENVSFAIRRLRNLTQSFLDACRANDSLRATAQPAQGGEGGEG